MAAAVQRNYDPNNRDEVQAVLRREIRAARLKVTLDRQLHRPTSDAVKRLAALDLPPFVDERRTRNVDQDH
ncbi:hypothetical protein [Nesterenkonia sp. Act20]|uniref:hypothetical protein n=1 Tax=Nesterenkonia sp. Act20 TaxID=1483432 RepID=UPI001C44306E|nr:hypothetical protein [Nesterenkonia sp. Act20]